jgi:hypothetical protein
VAKADVKKPAPNRTIADAKDPSLLAAMPACSAVKARP